MILSRKLMKNSSYLLINWVYVVDIIFQIMFDTMIKWKKNISIDLLNKQYDYQQKFVWRSQWTLGERQGKSFLDDFCYSFTALALKPPI